MPWSYVIVASITFFLGFVGGFYARGALDNADKPHIRLYLALLITLVWAMSVAAGIIVDGYQANHLIHMIMGGVVGFFFAKGESPLSGSS